jgi:hypothetical protein
MQPQIDIADAQHGGDQEDAHHDHQDVGLAGLGEIERQMVRRHRVKLFVQSILPELQVSKAALTDRCQAARCRSLQPERVGPKVQPEASGRRQEKD